MNDDILDKFVKIMVLLLGVFLFTVVAWESCNPEGIGTQRHTQQCERAGVSRGCLRYSARIDVASEGCYCITPGRDKLMYQLRGEEP